MKDSQKQREQSDKYVPLPHTSLLLSPLLLNRLHHPRLALLGLLDLSVSCPLRHTGLALGNNLHLQKFWGVIDVVKILMIDESEERRKWRISGG